MMLAGGLCLKIVKFKGKKVYFGRHMYFEFIFQYISSVLLIINQIFINTNRGRDRKRPYSYLANKDLFTQRMQSDEIEIKK